MRFANFDLHSTKTENLTQIAMENKLHLLRHSIPSVPCLDGTLKIQRVPSEDKILIFTASEIIFNEDLIQIGQNSKHKIVMRYKLSFVRQ